MKALTMLQFLLVGACFGDCDRLLFSRSESLGPCHQSLERALQRGDEYPRVLHFFVTTQKDLERVLNLSPGSDLLGSIFVDFELTPREFEKLLEKGFFNIINVSFRDSSLERQFYEGVGLNDAFEDMKRRRPEQKMNVFMAKRFRFDWDIEDYQRLKQARERFFFPRTPQWSQLRIKIQDGSAPIYQNAFVFDEFYFIRGVKLEHLSISRSEIVGARVSIDYGKGFSSILQRDLSYQMAIFVDFLNYSLRFINLETRGTSRLSFEAKGYQQLVLNYAVFEAGGQSFRVPFAGGRTLLLSDTSWKTRFGSFSLSTYSRIQLNGLSIQTIDLYHETNLSFVRPKAVLSVYHSLGSLAGETFGIGFAHKL